MKHFNILAEWSKPYTLSLVYQLKVLFEAFSEQLLRLVELCISDVYDASSMLHIEADLFAYQVKRLASYFYLWAVICLVAFC